MARYAARWRELSRRDFLAARRHSEPARSCSARCRWPSALLAADPAAAAVPVDGAILQAFADTIVPGRKAARTDLGDEIDPRAIAGVDPEPGAVEADALRLFQSPLLGFATLAPGVPRRAHARARCGAGRPVHRPAVRPPRRRWCMAGLDFGNPDRVLYEAAAAIPFVAFCAAGTQRNATSRTASGPARDGPSRHRAQRLPELLLPPPPRARAHEEGQPPLMAERVDVCIVGSGFGGSIAAWRLAELYRAAGIDPGAHPRARARPALQAHRLPPVDGRRPPVRGLQPDPVHRRHRRPDGHRERGRRRARTSTWPRRSAPPRETFERRDHHPDDGPDRRMWPKAIARTQMDNWYLPRRARRCACASPRGRRCRSRAGCGPPRSTPPGTPATACRWRSTSAAAWTPSGATPAASSARRTRVTTNYLASAERAGRARAAQPPGRAHPPLAGQRATATATW